MRILGLLTVLLTLVMIGPGCRSAPEHGQEQMPPPITLDPLPPIRALPVTTPVFFDRLDPDTTRDVPVSAQVEDRIQGMIEDHYFKDLGGDSAQTFFGLGDVLIRTLVLEDGPLRYYVVVLDSPMEVGLQAKVLCVDTVQGPYPDVFNVNIWAMYHRRGGSGNTLVPGNLKELFLKDAPDLELIDVDRDGINDLRATRLSHNGTYSAVERFDIHWGPHGLDTLNFEHRAVSPLGEGSGE